MICTIKLATYTYIRTFYFRVLSTTIIILQKKLDKWYDRFFVVGRSAFRRWRSAQLDKVQLTLLARYYVSVPQKKVPFVTLPQNCKLFGRNVIQICKSPFSYYCTH